MRVLIAYHSFSGNTEEMAEIIKERVEQSGHEAELYEIGYGVYIPKPHEYDVVMLGTFTWALGSTPDDVKDFVADIGYKPNNMAIFGSGETQFGGDEMFCKAVDKLVKFYNSSWPGLKIEQSPRGSQEKKVINWVDGIMMSREKELSIKTG